MKEWNSPYNPFNSMKVLMWREHLEHCATNDYLIPVTVDIDPSNRCNYNCIWCNAYDMIHQNHCDLTEEHLIRLADFLKDWGSDRKEGHPKSACIAGGGEPLMNRATMALLERMKINGLQNGLITNGSLLNNEYIDIIAKTCRWVGFSMDAATPDTYDKVKFGEVKTGKLFNKVVENIQKLTKRIRDISVKNDVAYKYLIHPLNASEIYEAAKLAKSIGVQDFHLRPVGWDNLTITKNKNKLNFAQLINTINEQVEEAMKLEDCNFHVYGIRHKFNPDFSIKKNFTRCWAIPILPTFGADGNVHTCFDMRGRKDLIMCKHIPDVTEIARYWNSDEHHKMIENINIEDCPRCTFGAYNEIVEKVIIKDCMCHLFP